MEGRAERVALPRLELLDEVLEAGQPHGRAIVRFGPACPLSRDEVVDALWSQKPRIAVAKIGDDGIALNPQTLEPGEDRLVLQALQRVLAPVAIPAASPTST